jgi:hypothetical protein
MRWGTPGPARNRGRILAPPLPLCTHHFAHFTSRPLAFLDILYLRLRLHLRHCLIAKA